MSDDKKSIHMTNYIRESNTNEIYGKVVITFKVRDKDIEIVDTDITIKNNNPSNLYFEEKLEQSSEANEYYNVITEDGSHFQIETVNRYVLKEENIEDTDQRVYLSAFPFQLGLYNNEEEMNKALGFGKPVKVGNTDMYVHGYSTSMMAVGGVLTGKLNEPSSFIIGIIEDYKDMIVNIADINISYTIIYINTAVGIIPVATKNGEKYIIDDGAMMPLNLIINNNANLSKEEKIKKEHIKDNLLTYKGTIKTANAYDLNMFDMDLPNYYSVTINDVCIKDYNKYIRGNDLIVQ